MTPDEDIEKLAKLSMWTVYERPHDYPEGFVVRRWIVGPSGQLLSGDAWFGETLDAVRGFLAQHYPGMIRLARSPGDEPQIVETWI